jgi:hypothetical protein
VSGQHWKRKIYASADSKGKKIQLPCNLCQREKSNYHAIFVKEKNPTTMQSLSKRKVQLLQDMGHYSPAREKPLQPLKEINHVIWVIVTGLPGPQVEKCNNYIYTI